MGLLAVHSVGSLSAVVRLDGEAVLPLAFAVQWLLGADETLASGAVQNDGFKLDGTGTRGAVVDAEAADFTCESSKETSVSRGNNTPDPHLRSLHSLSKISPRFKKKKKKHSSFVFL